MGLKIKKIYIEKKKSNHHDFMHLNINGLQIRILAQVEHFIHDITEIHVIVFYSLSRQKQKH